MDSSGLSKKEYLKKYLGGGEKKKKKKKSTQSLIIKSKIVDDDIDLKSMKPVNEDELDIYDLAEEAPQIVGIIDERPDDIRLMSEFRSTKKWKIVADGIEDVKITSVDHRKTDEGSSRVEKEISIQITKNIDKNKSDSDESPPRSEKTSVDGVDLEILKNIKKEIDSDSSPPRKSIKKRKDELRSGDRHKDSDATPSMRTIKKEKDDSDTSPPRRRKEKEDSDTSPPRRRKNKSDSDTSPPRRKRHKDDSDASLSRRRRHKDDLDASPPRRRGHKDDSDASPPRRKKRRDSDSPPLRKRKSLESSPSRKGINNRKKESAHHLSRRSEERSKRSKSPEKNKKNGDYGLKVISNKNSDTRREKESSRIEKTLLGKKAGLQSAEDMKKQDEKFRQKEKEMFEKMSDEMTGRHATAVVRNRKTGRVFNEKEEARKKRKQEEKEAEKIALYAVWGKGVKQVQDRQDKIKDDLYEMSKPLARYKDDKDLDEMLKNQERDGDPMLEYIRKKKKTESPKTSKVEYEGLHFPNRYDIKPGHQWDGVDRSNGFEKKWFEEQSAKKAREEEAFKWSTYDM